MKMVHIVGNRPQFIKLSLLVQALGKQNAERPIIIHTGQHFSDNMSTIFFKEFGIPPPDHFLNIHSLPHNELIGRMLIGLDQVLGAEKPDRVIVYGDTNSTLAGALTAKKKNIPLAHIESGIRTGNERMPEESNRYLTDRMADLNFTCTYLGLENLEKEGYGAAARPGGIFNTGDLMLDAAMQFRDRAKEQSSLLEDLSLTGNPFVLATIHRAENAEDPQVLREILNALHRIHRDIPVVFPVHPKTKQLIDSYDLDTHFICTPPLGYLDMLALVQACQYVITDSGGLSREAFFFHKPSLVVMDYPFWPEIFLNGPSLPAKARSGDILEKMQQLRKDTNIPFKTAIFGDGKAAEKISAILLATTDTTDTTDSRRTPSNAKNA
ncbi:non-hydrolyzing UDP-N-acetylglucosamine 2-epimerase [Flavitalea flava]